MVRHYLNEDITAMKILPLSGRYFSGVYVGGIPTAPCTCFSRYPGIVVRQKENLVHISLIQIVFM